MTEIETLEKQLESYTSGAAPVIMGGVAAIVNDGGDESMRQIEYASKMMTIKRYMRALAQSGMETSDAIEHFIRRFEGTGHLMETFGYSLATAAPGLVQSGSLTADQVEGYFQRIESILEAK